MRLMIKKLSILIITLFSLMLLWQDNIMAQPWLINTEPQYKNKSDLNFYDIQSNFYSWLELKSNTHIRGTKRFHRWEWYYEDRVFPTGDMPDPLKNYSEWQKSVSKISVIKNTITGKNASWVSISPNMVPQSIDETLISGMGRINCIAFHPTDPDILWIGASQGGVWKTVDNGETWICLTDELPLNRISDICIDPVNPDIIYIATGDIEYYGLDVLSNAFSTIYGLGIFKSIDGGANWAPCGLSFSFEEKDFTLIRKIYINPYNTTELIAAGISGIFKSFNSGDSWVQVTDNMVIDFDKNPLNDSCLFATGLLIPSTGGTNNVLRSYDFGNTWDTLDTHIIPEQTGVLRSELDISKSDTSIIYILSCGLDEGFYALYKSEDGGNSWFAVCARDTAGLEGAVPAPNIFGRTHGNYFNIPFIPADDGGQGTYDITLLIDPYNPDKILTGGINMWGSEDGGNTWDIVSFWINYMGPSIHADQHCSRINSLNNIMYQSNDGGIYRTDTTILANTDTIINCVDVFTLDITPGCYELPTVWEDISSGLHISEYYAISTCMTFPGIVVGGTQDNGTFMLRNGQWQKIYGGDGMVAMIDHFNPDVIYVTNQYGSLSKSTDGGLSFVSELELDITNTGEFGHWVTPYVMHPQNPQIIYAGFKNVWRSTDGAGSWTKLSSFGTSSTRSINSLVVAPSNPDYIYAARKGSIYRTTDGGISWVAIHPGLPVNLAVITSICVADNDPENIWVSFNGYADGIKVFNSTDAGNNWDNVSGSLPNVGANTLVFQYGTIDGVSHAVYLGTDLGIYYTNDSIQQLPDRWALYSEGLPKVVINDLDIQYGSQKLYAATYGRGLWESNLYSPSIVEGIEIINEPEFFVNVFPNPASGNINIKISDLGTHEVILSLYNITGSKLIEVKEPVLDEFGYRLDISGLSCGVYILRILVDNSAFTHKIIKNED